MGAITKTFQVTLDTKRPPSNREFECVVGDTGNIIEVALFDDGTPVDLSDAHIIAVFSNKNGTYLQDQLEDDGGVSVLGAEHNIIRIELHPPAYAAGVNEVEIQVWTDADEDEADDTLITTARFNFGGKTSIVNADTVKASAEYPILVRLINEAQTAINDAENATALAGASAEQADDARDAALLAKESADTAAASASGSASAANALILKLSNPSITIENGDTPSATVAVTETGIEFHLVVQKGADGRPAEIGTEAGILVETGTNGVLVAGRKLIIATDDPEDVEELRAGDIYVKEHQQGAGELPAGGTTGQVLVKASGDDYDADWEDAPSSGIQGVQISGTDLTPDADGKVDVPKASGSSLGVIKASATFGTGVYGATGELVAVARTKSEYENGSTNVFVGKGTLENIKSDITRRALTDTTQQAYTETEKANARGVIGAVGGTGNIVVDNIDPAVKAADLADGDIYIYFPDMP